MLTSPVLTFALAAAVLTVTPGPDTLLVVRNVIRGGRGDGIITTFGICSGLFIHATFSAIGISVVLLYSAAAFNVVKIAGACYLVWLGVRSLVSAARGTHHPAGADRAAAPRAVPPTQCFTEGFLSNVLNPNTAVFYLAFLPQFIGPSDPVLRTSLLLAVIHYVESISWLVGVSLAVDRARRLLVRAVIWRWLDGICGTLLVGLGVRLAFARR